MAKFVLAYTGGVMAESPAEQEAVMAQWMQWFGSIGESIVDGGNPFGGSIAVGAGGSTGPVSANLTGYTIINAESLESAATLVSQCPVLSNGGSIEIYEAMDM